jgi:hypothetical protein
MNSSNDPAGVSLAERIASAAELIQRNSGGRAVCSLTKAGESVPAVKYAEGRWAALREVQRATSGEVELGVAVTAAEVTWRAHLDRLRSRAAGSDWIAYRSGGLDALAELAQGLAD